MLYLRQAAQHPSGQFPYGPAIQFLHFHSGTMLPDLTSNRFWNGNYQASGPNDPMLHSLHDYQISGSTSPHGLHCRSSYCGNSSHQSFLLLWSADWWSSLLHLQVPFWCSYPAALHHPEIHSPVPDNQELPIVHKNFPGLLKAAIVRYAFTLEPFAR